MEVFDTFIINSPIINSCIVQYDLGKCSLCEFLALKGTLLSLCIQIEHYPEIQLKIDVRSPDKDI